LSRVLVRSYEEDVEMDEEIRVAVDNVRKYGFKNNDTLCHGNMGDTELLMAVSQLYGNKELYEQALQIGIQVINNYRETGSYQCDAPDDIQSFGMFVGIAGVGMQLLRLLQPNEIPSVMTLENVKG
ncbi:type 2 lantipeptide synthetase LanM, partial [Bacillus pseudomycoides]|uniref:lanthionine synthetase LanC family protein n=1 Tax=Bacillus pseudomycoides TaxID=64104 RepID=UPI000C017F75